MGHLGCWSQLGKLPGNVPPALRIRPIQAPILVIVTGKGVGRSASSESPRTAVSFRNSSVWGEIPDLNNHRFAARYQARFRFCTRFESVRLIIFVLSGLRPGRFKSTGNRSSLLSSSSSVSSSSPSLC
jgi:hypothetical protein